MTDDAKLWTEILQSPLVEWPSFQEKLVAYFRLVAGIDSFSVNEQLTGTATHHYNDVMRLCSKLKLLMDGCTRLRYLYLGLWPEFKVIIFIHTFYSPEKFLQELVRLEHLQTMSDSSQSNISTFAYTAQDFGPTVMEHPSYSNQHGFVQQQPNLHSPNHASQD